jgi:hypothetical protein
MTDIAAEGAANALQSIAVKLLQADIVTNEGCGVLQREARLIASGRANLNWALEIGRGEPIQFEWCKDKNDDDVRPTIIAKFDIDQTHPVFPPFKSLQIAMELHNLNDEPVARWHIDRANVADNVQDGPLYHLQYGGHNAGLRTFDAILKEPRWCHPPLEVGLLCEVVAANFFTEKWEEHLRRDPTWCSSIQLLQRLCYTNYVEQLVASLDVSHSTTLGGMWADGWVPQKAIN